MPRRERLPTDVAQQHWEQAEEEAGRGRYPGRVVASQYPSLFGQHSTADHNGKTCRRSAAPIHALGTSTLFPEARNWGRGRRRASDHIARAWGGKTNTNWTLRPSVCPTLGVSLCPVCERGISSRTQSDRRRDLFRVIVPEIPKIKSMTVRESLLGTADSGSQ